MWRNVPGRHRASGPELNSTQGRHRGSVGSQLEFNRNFTRIAAKWRLISCLSRKGLRSSTTQRQVRVSAAIRAELIMKAEHVGANSFKCIETRVTSRMSHNLVHSPRLKLRFRCATSFADRETETRFPNAVVSALTPLISLIEQNCVTRARFDPLLRPQFVVSEQLGR